VSQQPPEEDAARRDAEAGDEPRPDPGEADPGTPSEEDAAPTDRDVVEAEERADAREAEPGVTETLEPPEAPVPDAPPAEDEPVQDAAEPGPLEGVEPEPDPEATPASGPVLETEIPEEAEQPAGEPVPEEPQPEEPAEVEVDVDVSLDGDQRQEEGAPEAAREPAAEEAPEEPAEEPAASQEEGAADEAVTAPSGDPFAGAGEWYVIHTYAGYENKVKTNLQSRINTMQMQDKIFDVVIPMEDVMEIKGGRKQVVQKKVFPGYLLVKMTYDDDSWYVVRNTPGVTGFVSSGTGQKPTPLSRREVEKILAVKKEEVKPTFRLDFEEGDVVRIISGPFADFNGTIDEINVDQSKVKVLVNIFDRETPVELSFDQVARV
jgi:transcription termination/antitermination protein NusG